MRIQPELEKVSKRAIGLASLAGALSWQCAKFAPDIAVDASGGMAGTAGTEVGAGAGASAGIGGVGEAGSAGAASELSAVRPERSLIESNPDALAYFTLERTLSRATAELGADVYRAYALSFAERSTDPASPGPRCDDENPSSNGLSSMNGFSLPCPAEAADLYWQLTAWKPLAVTNRFDLAPMGGETCGEQHLSFFYDTSFMGQPEFPARAYLSFAAVIENPAPDRGLEGCRPLLEFWASLGRHEYDAPDRRARALEHVFFGASLSTDNLPESPELAGLKRSAFLPMISPEHFGHAGRLQLLYFGDLGDWHFFEHALVPAQEGFVLRRPLTQSLPVAALLNEHPKREQCIDELLSSVPGLLNEDVNLLRLDIDPACFAATNSVMETTLAAGMISEPLGPDLRARLDAHMKQSYPDSGLHGEHLARRAEFAGTCSGCHNLVNSPWVNPSSISQVSRDLMQACAASGPDVSRRCYARSPLLNAIFVPHWANVLNDFLQHPGAYGPLPAGEHSRTAIDGAQLVRQNP
jgi:hypothetical protein